MKSFCTTIIYVLITFSSVETISGQKRSSYSRETRAIYRAVAEEQSKASPGGKIIWGGIALVIVIIGIVSSINSANAKEKRQKEQLAEYERHQQILVAMQLQKQKELDEQRLREDQINKEHTKNLRDLVDKALSENPRLQTPLKQTYQYLDQGNWNEALTAFQKVKMDFERFSYLFNKYGQEVGTKLYKGEVWLTMSEDQLTDAKGQPTKIEIEQLKTKTKKIYIYGKKSSGDVFTFENGFMTKLIDR